MGAQIEWFQTSDLFYDLPHLWGTLFQKLISVLSVLFIVLLAIKDKEVVDEKENYFNILEFEFKFDECGKICQFT